ncbi:hypothetical protein ACFOG5_21075 [Pedobacter fastidiosus]|uniref:Uncharacterized protein n=1 Tax=Pedobacter fastidiosus TaxID=2765361 RepID=A0ABR7KNU6_9SPHI|nr:hypothetical protein [Pedobacter fastidiosus]MBC6109758.1 hypothetical protein [Pedobacter fastidiosus]
MQPIQDKDFDKLFKDAFADAEVTPSRDLWSSIESEIEPKKKRIVPIYWLSAAAVLLIATVGVLVYQQQNTANPDKNLASNGRESVKPVVKTNSVKDSITPASQPIESQVESTLPIATKPSSSIAKTIEVKPLEKQRIVTAPEMQKQDTYIATVEVPRQEIIKKKIEEAIQQPKEEVIAMVETPANDVVNENDLSNKGIRNVGDVVNLIVNKVDKRKDKFIQFRTDDDDSSLSSINIGPFKFGKKNKK